MRKLLKWIGLIILVILAIIVIAAVAVAAGKPLEVMEVNLEGPKAG